MGNTEDNWKRHFKSEIVLQQHCHPVSNWARSEKWWETTDVTQLQKILCILLLETFMNESGNEAPLGSRAFSQRLRNHADATWAISCLWHCRLRGTAWPTACLGKCWENCTELATLVPFQQIPGGPWQAAAPPLHESWHEECHRAQFFHHFYLISMQNLQGIWWSVWAAMPAITLMTRSFMYLFPPHADSTLPNLCVASKDSMAGRGCSQKR